MFAINAGNHLTDGICRNTFIFTETSAMVDDAPHNLVGGDYIKLLYDAPHNQNFDTESHCITRVHNWGEVYFAINYIANNS